MLCGNALIGPFVAGADAGGRLSGAVGGGATLVGVSCRTRGRGGADEATGPCAGGGCAGGGRDCSGREGGGGGRDGCDTAPGP
jgi:hypothetical protein